MIPKVIHYCWFSGDEKPKQILDCIESWKKYCSDYEIIEWNTTNFEVNCSTFTRESYGVKKWAFVADYFRLWVLYNHGGIYLDADVEIIKPFDDLLDTTSFIGFDSYSVFGTCVIGSTKGNEWVKYLLSYYNNRPFILKNSTLDLTPNPSILTSMTKTYYPEIQLNNTLQHLSSGLIIYPKEYFSPKDLITGDMVFTKNTHSIHHFAGSWLNDNITSARNYSYKIITKYKIISYFYHSRLGRKMIEKPILLLANCKVNGIKYTFTRAFNLLKHK